MKNSIKLAGVLSILLIISATNLSVANVNIKQNSTTGNIIYVDDIPGEGPDNPPEDFNKIQDAFENAVDGDTIFVYSGIYYFGLELIWDKNVMNPVFQEI